MLYSIDLEFSEIWFNQTGLVIISSTGEEYMYFQSHRRRVSMKSSVLQRLTLNILELADRRLNE